MQNRIHYFKWTAGLIVVTDSFLTGTKNDKCGTRHDPLFMTQLGADFAAKGFLNLMTSSPVATGLAH